MKPLNSLDLVKIWSLVERTGLIMGSGGASNVNVVEAADILREKGIKRVGPYRVPRTMALLLLLVSLLYSK